MIIRPVVSCRSRTRHQPDRLAAPDVEADAVHRAHRGGRPARPEPAAHREVLHQILHLQQNGDLQQLGQIGRRGDRHLTPPGTDSEPRAVAGLDEGHVARLALRARRWHRGAKGHPAGRFAGSGGRPSIGMSRWSGRPSLGSASMSRRV